VDTRGLYQSTRENLFFDAGFEHGLLAARQDCLAERMANDPVARRLLSEINQVTLTTELPPDRASTLMRRLEHFDDLRRKANLYQTVLQAQVEGLAENLTEMERQVHGLLDSKRARAA
jgi:tRNA A37 threonylcarbamoyladenosine synthetase subunit TsaC/SUA5/YrdC